MNILKESVGGSGETVNRGGGDPAFWPFHVNSPCFTCDVADAGLRPACPRPPQNQEASPRLSTPPPGAKRVGAGSWQKLDCWSREPREAGRLSASAAVTSAVLRAARPRAVPAPGRRRGVPARPPPGAGAPFLPARPSSASSVSRGKAAACYRAPHPRLGNPLSCRRHPSPVAPRRRLHLRASGSPRAARAPSPLCRQVSRSPAAAAGPAARACEVPGRRSEAARAWPCHPQSPGRQPGVPRAPELCWSRRKKPRRKTE